MTDRWLRELRDYETGRGHRDTVRALTELLAYRRAAQRLRKAYGKFGPPTAGGSLDRAVLDLLAVEAR